MRVTSITVYTGVLNCLAIMKHFLKGREYRRIKKMCLDLIPGEKIKEIGKVKLDYSPSGIDFAEAVEYVWKFLLQTEEASKTNCVELNGKGFHSRTVVECMNVLFRHQDFLCLEELCTMIDDKDLDREAKGIKRLLLETRNNMVVRKSGGD